MQLLQVGACTFALPPKLLLVIEEEVVECFVAKVSIGLRYALTIWISKVCHILIALAVGTSRPVWYDLTHVSNREKLG